MSRRVELGAHVLRRRDFPSTEDWARDRSRIQGLQSELYTYVGRFSADELSERLEVSNSPWEGTGDAVERVLQLIEAGWVSVESRPCFAGWAGQAVGVVDEAVDLSDLIPPEPLPAVEAAPMHVATDSVTAAQVLTLLAAAKTGSPFCEICA